MSNDSEEFSNFTNREINRLFVGRLIGQGCSRRVYENRLDPTTVIKIEETGGSFHNVSEWETWNGFQWDKKIADWLAPCVAISPSGSVLIQKRVEPVRISEVPAKMPSFLTDLKTENFGWLNKKIVCCDYGSLIYNPSTRLRKANWS